MCIAREAAEAEALAVKEATEAELRLLREAAATGGPAGGSR